jgi:hypothetical protein
MLYTLRDASAVRPSASWGIAMEDHHGAVEEYSSYLDVRPENIIAESRSLVHVITTSAHRLITSMVGSSPAYEVTCMIDSSKPSDHDWSPPFEQVSEVLKQMVEAHPSITRLSIRFEKL